jgi:D-alanine-D-alanine ligase-like ATP-grasp enzyme
VIPDEIAQRCVQVAQDEDLLLAGFDFRVDPSGRWHCLEVNPVPTFLPYEMSTGQPIGAAVVDALLR